ncbi:MAG: Flp pilus assembly complex ATPase component TadA, partial [Pseudorhodobacter sp.]|nr:Flp pilus assembly complex ATPase component TadA [Frankiaceae bacterium]
MKQLGDILLEDGLLTPEQLSTAVEEQRRLGRSLGRVLVDLGHLSEGQLVAALATQIGLRFVDLSDYPVDGSAVSRVSHTVCRRHNALPIGYDEGKLVVAMADPANVFAIDDIRALTGLEVRPVVATRPDVLAAINRYHRGDAEMDDLTLALDAKDEEDDLSKIKEVVEDAPIVKFVNLLITQAIQDRASDIHIEPAERDLRVRFRIDGVLHEVMRSPKTITAGVTSRLKIMADINIAERRIPQDGRLSVTANGSKIDLRVATLPTVWGEKIVMRILDNSTAMLKLSDLGFSDPNYEVYSRSFVKPYGMILVTGPTGSGKSTTLYGTLNIVSRPEVNVITVEDPVEYRLPGINQVQTNVKAGLTF